MKKYSVIYADPPWRYKVYSKKGLGRSAESHYPTMSLEDIKALPIGELAAKDCALFMWITFPCMQEAFQVLEAWDLNTKRRLLSGSSRTGCPTVSFGAWGTGHGQTLNSASLQRKAIPNGQAPVCIRSS